MILARDKYGRIGRKVRSNGMQAVIEPATIGEARGTVYVSEQKLADDQEIFRKAERRNAMLQAEAVNRRVRQEADAARDFHKRDIAVRNQMNRPDPMNEKMRKHFGLAYFKSEEQKTSDSLTIKADFSDIEEVPGSKMTGGDEWRADYRQHLIKGNPLTRDGEWNGGVTDYDAIVKGHEFENSEPQVAGGTILGRNAGDPCPVPALQSTRERIMSEVAVSYPSFPKIQMPEAKSMGDFWDDVWTNTKESVAKEVPKAIVGAIAPKPPSGSAPSGGGGQVVYQQAPGTISTSYMPQQMPPWIIYSALGLLGVGVLLTAVKIIKD